ncbi:MAG: acyltransferase family protein [Novosphingobium sp.]|nr:acyltransferase family protein [Novosphingobium sp.]MCP5401641.1 acyltransferase family protein [Novosphingobium sp.]
MGQAPASGDPSQRIHFLDVSRALFMLLGIPFHAALVYSSAIWAVSSPDKSAALEYLPTILSSFRMPGFFMIAGFFAALLLQRRSAADWLRMRIVRLGIPLLTGIAMIVPLQNAVLRLAPLNAVQLPGSDANALFSHLWFLPVLLMLCAGLAIGWKLVRRVRWPDLPFWSLGLLVGLWLIGLQYAKTIVNLAPMGGFIDLQSVLADAPFFMLGVAARLNPAILARLTRQDGKVVAIGLLALVVHCQLRHPIGPAEFAVSKLSEGLAALCLMQTVIAILARWFDRPSPIVDRMVDASFTIYLLHHPVIIVLSVLLLPLAVPPLVEWTLICAATLTLSYAMHRAISRSGLLLLLFNGVVPRSGRGLLTQPSAPTPS